MINLSFRKFSDFVILYLLLLQSLSYCLHGSSTTATTMHVTCGTDVELTCPIRSIKTSDDVISWFRPNSTNNNRLSFIAIGDILLPEYAAIGRYNLISSSSFSPRLLITNVIIEDQGYFKCKSSSFGQHIIKLIVNSHPHLSPTSPILLYPVNRTFAITCSLPCDSSININNLIWLVNGHPLNDDQHQYLIETSSFNTQTLTIFLNKNRHHHFHQANYTCRYNGKDSTIFVRRRTKEELHRLPRQEGSSSAYLIQTAFDTAQKQYQLTYKDILLYLLFLKLIHCAI